jgi:hypothetical protein
MQFMKRLLIGMSGATLAAMLLMVSAPKTVHAVVAALVRDVDNPGRATIVAPTCDAKLVTSTGGTFNCELAYSGSPYTVPAAQRLVIEQVSASCDTPPTNVVNGALLSLTEGGVGVNVPFVFTPQGPPGGLVVLPGFIEFTLNQAVRYYADPGTSLTFQADSTDDTSHTGCRFAVNGYLISYP